MSRSIIEFFQHIRMSFGVDYELVWDVIENEIEELNFQIGKIIEEEKIRL